MTTDTCRLHLLPLRQSWGYSCSPLHAACAGVCDIFEAGDVESEVDGGNPACIVMQRGSLSLADWLSKMESSPSALGRKNMLFQLAEGLNYLHARQVSLQLAMPHSGLRRASNILTCWVDPPCVPPASPCSRTVPSSHNGI